MTRRVPIGALGHPLYVNGKLFPEPVVISHVPGVGSVAMRKCGQPAYGSVDPSMGGLGAYVGYRANLGADEVLPGSSPAALPPAAAAPPLTGMQIAYAIASTAATVGGIYHGYKRNDSIGWAIWWGIMAGAFPVITVPIALAQGFGKRKGMTPNRSRRSGKRRRRNPKRRSGVLTQREQIALAGKTAHERRDDVTNAFNRDYYSGKLSGLRYSPDAAWKIYKAAYNRSRKRGGGAVSWRGVR